MSQHGGGRVLASVGGGLERSVMGRPVNADRQAGNDGYAGGTEEGAQFPGVGQSVH
jgi:hypothetical protein